LSSDRRYLELHGNVWRVVVPVPRALHEVIGCTKLKKRLGTDSLRLANQLKWVVVAELKKQIRQAATGSRADPLFEEAMAMREAVLIDSTVEERNDFSALDAIELRAEELRGEPIEKCEATGGPIYDSDRETLAGMYLAIASGRETPIASSLGRWHSEASDRKERTKGDDTRAVGFLETWCRINSVKPTVEAVTRKAAGRFIGDLPTLARSNQTIQRLTNKTANKYISCLSSYWKWMRARGLVSDNVWSEQSLSKERAGDNEKPREFRDDELKALFEGSPPPPLGAVMYIAALTGARIDTIVSLRVKDCENGVFRFKRQKREVSDRYVPVHSMLTELVAKLTRGRLTTESLFPEYPTPKNGSGREHSMTAVKAFVRYRRSVGVDDVVPGKRRSRVTFHSFRRWFITQAERADIPGPTIATVVGHKRSGMTFGTYSGGPDLEQRRRCVEAVRLPEEERMLSLIKIAAVRQ
jgi:integrase